MTWTFFARVPEGSIAPWGHGLIVLDLYRRQYTTCLVPFNILARLLLAFYFWLRVPRWIKWTHDQWK